MLIFSLIVCCIDVRYLNMYYFEFLHLFIYIYIFVYIYIQTVYIYIQGVSQL